MLSDVNLHICANIYYASFICKRWHKDMCKKYRWLIKQMNRQRHDLYKLKIFTNRWLILYSPVNFSQRKSIPLEHHSFFQDRKIKQLEEVLSDWNWKKKCVLIIPIKLMTTLNEWTLIHDSGCNIPMLGIGYRPLSSRRIGA